MRIKPADLRTYVKYRDGEMVGVEYFHKPTGVSTGIQPTHERADQCLRDGIEEYLNLWGSVPDVAPDA